MEPEPFEVKSPEPLSSNIASELCRPRVAARVIDAFSLKRTSRLIRGISMVCTIKYVRLGSVFCYDLSWSSLKKDGAKIVWWRATVE